MVPAGGFRRGGCGAGAACTRGRARAGDHAAGREVSGRFFEKKLRKKRLTARIGVLAVGLAANSTRMNFIITALPEQDFECYFAMSGAELAGKLARRMVADEKPGYPCRVSLLDAEIGEEVLLVNYTHQLADSPFRAPYRPASLPPEEIRFAPARTARVL